MKILLTGAQGQVGQAIIALAQQKNITLIALSRRDLDITDAQQVSDVFQKYQPDIVINAAAYTAVDLAEEQREQAMLINATGPKNLAKAAAAHHALLIHLSTDYIFDGTKVGAYIENDQANPINVYGLSKLQGEQMVQQFAQDFIVLRVSWVFGIVGQNFVKTILRLAQEKTELKIVDDQYGCPTSAHSIAQVVFKIIQQWPQKKLSGVYHYCDRDVTTWFGFAAKIIDMAKSRWPIKVQQLMPITTDQMPRPAKRPMNSCLNCQQIKQTFDIDQASWEAELAEVLNQLARDR